MKIWIFDGKAVKVIEATEVAEAVEVIEAAEVLRSEKSLLRTESSRLLNSNSCDVLKIFSFW